ncbi:MAG: HipA domain-containing protein [Coriobacteriia bacterium]|nr:HipA domain-containing protein [Coriobacteriia bacterium]
MKLCIYQDRTRVGELFTNAQGIFFSYATSYLQSGAYPISLSLPLQQEPFPEKVALPFFEGLLLEEQQRIEISKYLGTSSASIMRLLKSLAGDCVGNLTILDEDTDIETINQKNSYRKLSSHELESLLKPQSAERLRFIVQGRLSLAGAQAKVGLFKNNSRWYATEGLAATTHIVKPASSTHESLLANEFFMMQLAHACGLQTATTEVLTAGAKHALTSKRFDRLHTSEGVIRLSQEDFCQALAVLSQKKYEIDGGPGFKQLFQTVLLNVSKPQQNLQQLLKLTLFNYLIGNCDAHAKNYSLLRDHQVGNLELAPAYDLISTTFYDVFERSMAMKIGNHSHIDRINAIDFELFADEVGISMQAISAELATLHTSIEQSLSEVTALVVETVPDSNKNATKLRKHIEQELTQRGSILN